LALYTRSGGAREAQQQIADLLKRAGSNLSRQISKAPIQAMAVAIAYPEPRRGKRTDLVVPFIQMSPRGLHAVALRWLLISGQEGTERIKIWCTNCAGVGG
jgi:hypothetical protein